MSTVHISIDDSLFSRKTNNMLKVLNDPSLRYEINEIIGNKLNQYVPMKSGALRESLTVDESSISWSTPYAHYQWEGEVYGPNLIGFDSNGTARWISRKPKQPMGYKIGSRAGTVWLRPQFGRDYNQYTEYIEWTFGYTTDKTQSHWDKLYTESNQDSRAFRARTNAEISRFVKKALQRAGL